MHFPDSFSTFTEFFIMMEPCDMDLKQLMALESHLEMPCVQELLAVALRTQEGNPAAVHRTQPEDVREPC